MIKTVLVLEHNTSTIQQSTQDWVALMAPQYNSNGSSLALLCAPNESPGDFAKAWLSCITCTAARMIAVWSSPTSTLRMFRPEIWYSQCLHEVTAQQTRVTCVACGTDNAYLNTIFAK